MADETRTPGPMGGLRGKGSKKKKKRVLSADEFLKIKDSKQEFTGPKSTKGSFGDFVNKFRDGESKVKVITMAKGGRAGYKGGKSVKKMGCAIKGKSPILR
jgi:hypothetical protein